MTTAIEDQIRRLANAIWVSEGRPEGRHEEHWAEATRQIEGAGTSSDGRAE